MYSCVLWVPIDVVKERMQIQTKAGHAVPNPTGHYYKSTTHAFQIILRNEGIRGIYKVRCPPALENPRACLTGTVIGLWCDNWQFWSL